MFNFCFSNSGNVSWNLGAVIVVLLTLIFSSAVGQDLIPRATCNKYCYEKCDRLPYTEIDDCRTANSRCDCRHAATWRNPALVTGIVFTLLGLFVLTAVVYRKCTRGSIPRGAIVAHPIGPTHLQPNYPVQYAYYNHASPMQTMNYIGHPPEMPPPQPQQLQPPSFIVAPATTTTATVHYNNTPTDPAASSEYMPPPPYNSVVSEKEACQQKY